MFASALIVFRETLEAALILGILAAATRGISGRDRWLGAGVAMGLAGALAVAGLTDRIAGLADGLGHELFNAVVLAIAVAMLAWHNIWMARHGREMARHAKQLGQAVGSGSLSMTALSVAVALAILREGAETVLFMQGLLSDGSSSGALLAGGGLGLAGGAAAGIALYAGILRIPAALFFSATSGLILLLAAAMASQMARQLIQADLLPSLAAPLTTPAWDLHGVLPTDSAFGALLHALIGYEATPAGIQVLFYLAAAGLILAGMRWARTSVPVPTPNYN